MFHPNDDRPALDATRAHAAVKAALIRWEANDDLSHDEGATLVIKALEDALKEEREVGP